jgi:hypothetical protein
MAFTSYACAGGKIVEIDANEDSEAVANMLKRKRAAGVAQALAAQIVS